ncbi:WD40 repeat domain-containing protein [Actinokineospora sp.]|uniref:WD40 repeat domain-containing protein n=1 Tax=Actinokineospora sp. TaxID=1872133 RepID=UPI003D6C47F6
MITAPFTGHPGLVRAIAIEPDGSRIITGGDDGTVRFWDATDGEELAVVHVLPGGVRSLAAFGDVVFCGGPDGSRTLTSGSTIAHVGVVPIGAIARDEDIWFCGLDGSIAIHTYGDIATYDGPVHAAAVDNSRLFYGGPAGLVQTISSRAPSVATITAHEGGVTAIATARGTGTVVSAGRDGLVKVWQAEEDRVVHTFSGDGEPLHAVAISADGHVVTFGGASGRVWQWDRRTDAVTQHA